MASWKSCVASSNGMWCRQRLRCSLTVSALACAALLAADGASAQGEPQLEPCPGGGYNPTPTDVAVAAVPIVVESTTDDYFVLYVKHDMDGTEVEIPVLVKRGEADTTTLAENVEALPKERYRVEKYLVSDPADVDGDCVDDITELDNLGSMNPVNSAAAWWRRNSFFFWFFFVSLRGPSCPFVDIFLSFLPLRGLRADVSCHW